MCKEASSCIDEKMRNSLVYELHKAFCFLVGLNPEVTKYKTHASGKNVLRLAKQHLWFGRNGIQTMVSFFTKR